jgi:hypothetical protein
MTFAKDDLIAALRTRYDHYSAQAVFEMARERAGLPDRLAFDTSELRTWRAGLAAVGDRVTGVLARIDELLASAGGPSAGGLGKRTPEGTVKAEPVKQQPPKAEPAKADGGKAEAAKADKPAGMIEMTIVLKGVEVEQGVHLLVCGATHALGDWNPDRARRLEPAGDAWQVTVSVPREAELAFKFLRRAADGSVTWEGGENRRVVAAPRVETVWQSG